jgi:hypothetical protein
MILSYYMDHHVPRAITQALRVRGIDVLTAYEDGADQIPDSEILDRATQMRRVLLPKTMVFYPTTTFSPKQQDTRQKVVSFRV